MTDTLSPTPCTPAPITHPAALLVAVLCAAFALPLSFTGPALAAPAMAAALAGSPVERLWITNAFMLTFGSTLLLAGSLADRWGRRPVFLGGTGLFALAALLTTLAPTLAVVLGLRALQGLGAAAALASGSAALASAYAPPQRLRAFSLLGTTFGLGLALGPIAAGWLVDHLGWRVMFGAVAAISLLAMALAWRHLPADRPARAGRLDIAGSVSFVAAIGLFTAAVLQAPSMGWASPRLQAAGAAALLLAVAFVRLERRSASPLLDLTLFGHAPFVGVQLLALAPAFSFVVLLVLLPMRLIGIDGHPPGAAGWLMLALSAPMVLVPPLAAKWAARWSAAPVCIVGLIVTAAGLGWLSTWTPTTPLRGLVAPLLVLGCGIGLPWGLMDGLAVSVVPAARAGMAAGLFNTVRVGGEGVALAITSTALSLLAAHQLAGLAPQAAAPVLAAGQALAAGDLDRAREWLPGLSVAQLQASYAHAFRLVSRGLAVLTLGNALAVAWLLRKSTPA